jgi:hypothetical protein
VKKAATPLRDALLALIKWIGKKLDKVVDIVITVGVTAAAVHVGATHSEPLRKALDAVIAWLDIVAHKSF